MTNVEAWEIDYLERARRVRESLEREFLEIPVGPMRSPEEEHVRSVYEIEQERHDAE